MDNSLKIERKQSKKSNLTYLALTYNGYVLTFNPRTLCVVSGLHWETLKQIKIGEPLVLVGKEHND